MVVRLTEHFRDLETFEEDHDRETREILAAALYETHHDHIHADATLDDIRNRHE